ncbi:hypothetical protein DBR40_24680 [Pedobacter sp. KBW01]|uniref:hypothetical protein n=1 Tax=Pedobacter sp. KBW01 TaxID=2153364 RepID=UPI000F596035|nr:hypothetical protein [Pedobacter sp. KBW01]RQO65072.1 hypothetical protein DBR40_24680 [Pedobacter sp. KBW01]
MSDELLPTPPPGELSPIDEIPNASSLMNAKILGINNDGTTKLFKISDIKGDYKGQAVIETNPGSPVLAQFYSAKPGVYTHFKDADNLSLVIPAKVGDDFVLTAVLTFDGEHWSAMYSPIEISLEGYADRKAIDDNFNGTQEIVSKGKSFNTTLFPPSFYFNGDVFSGAGSPLGNPAIKFNIVKFTIKAQSTIITKVHVRITKNNRFGDVLGFKQLNGLSLAANTEHLITVVFDTVIDNTAGYQLYFEYAADQRTDTFGVGQSDHNPFPQSDFAISSYNMNGSMVFPLEQDTSTGPDLGTGVLVEFFNDEMVYTPNTKLLTEVNNEIVTAHPALPSLQETTDLLNKTSELIDVFESAEEPLLKAVSSYQDTSSTFSGWLAPIGSPQNFSGINFNVRARGTEVTAIYWQICKASDFSILASGTKVVSVPPATSKDIPIGFTQIVNAGNDELLFGYKANQFIDAFGVDTNEESIFPNPPFTIAHYVVNGNLEASFNPISSGQRNLWVQIGAFVTKAKPTEGFMERIQSEIDFPPPSGMFVPYVNIILNSKIYALVGKQTNIYFKNILDTNIAFDLLDIDVVCLVGTQYEKFLRFDPVASGNFDVSIKVRYQNVLLAAYNGKINISDTANGTGEALHINLFGDSTNAAGQPQQIIIDEQVTDPLDIIFQGSLGTAPNLFEGRGGWTIGDYAGAGRTFYKIPVTGLTTTPAPGAIYTNNSSTFGVREINVSSGTGYISIEKISGPNDPLTDGTLIKDSGTGDANIPYTGMSVVSGNPLWNPGTSAIDYSYYLTNRGLTMISGDIFGIHLGINDLYGSLDDESMQYNIDAMITLLKSILTKVHTAVPGINCAIMSPIMPSISQDAFGENGGTYQNRARYVRNIQSYQKRLILEFDNIDAETDKNFLIPWNAIIDTENNFPKQLVDANSRNTDQIVRYINAVHPVTPGYNQMGDQLKAFAKSIV